MKLLKFLVNKPSMEKKPRDDYLEVASQVIHYAKGLPLALEIIGFDLCGRTKLEWKSAIDKYEKFPKKRFKRYLK